MPSAKLTIRLHEPIGRIRPELYGHFIEHLGECVDKGIWVGCDSKIPNIDGIRNDLVEALRRIHAPVLRWPGGCFADDYHWMDGIGPRERRPRTINLHWGHTVETNEFGTHEFMRLCEVVGAKPYLAGNLGSGTVREMRDWVEYCNYAGDSTLARMRAANGSPKPFGVRYWGVGNENWGCGGHFCPEDYAVEYKRFATYLPSFSGSESFLIACGPDSGRPGYHANWTRRFFEKLGKFNRIHGLAAHYYCGTAGEPASFTTDQWYELLASASRMNDVITTHRAVMDEFDPQRKIGLLVDEWGAWHRPTPGRNPLHYWQPNTLRDALVAAITLNIFNNHADKLVMCNIAQTVNVLQALCHTDGEKLVLTPTHHVYDMYQHHQSGEALRTVVESPEVAFVMNDQRHSIPVLTASASIKSRDLTLSMTNCHTSLPQEIEIDLAGAAPSGAVVQTLTHTDLAAQNTVDQPRELVAVESRVEISSGARLTVPAASVQVLRWKLR